MVALHKYNTFGKRFLAGLIDGFIFLPLDLLTHRLENSGNKTLFIALSLIYLVCWTFYVVIGHGKYGQTIGKRVMNIKVLDLQEQNSIGYKKAFYREAVWVFAEAIWLIYFISIYYSSDMQSEGLKGDYFVSYIHLTMSVWFVLELVTMHFNSKRRALHDYIAGSVVVDLNEIKREDLQKRHQELIGSI